ncbi:hypothetical protein AALB19_14455 [Oscillospiraceae bacterium 50-58]
MKKLSHAFIKAVSLLLVISMLCGTVSAIQISETDKVSDEVSTVYLSDSVRIDGYTDQNGNAILCKYTDGVLTQRNTVFNGNSTYYQRETFGDNPVCELVYVDEYISIETILTPYAETKSTTIHGNIQFRNTTIYGYVYNKLNVTCLVTEPGKTSCSVNKFKGELFDLATIVITNLFASKSKALSLTVLIQNAIPFLKKVAIAYGAKLVGDYIESLLTFPVAGTQTTYTWHITDSNFPDDVEDTDGTGETRVLIGYRYILNDINHPELKNEVICEDYTPETHWKNNAFATMLHNTIYGYAPDKIISWSSLG